MSSNRIDGAEAKAPATTAMVEQLVERVQTHHLNDDVSLVRQVFDDVVALAWEHYGTTTRVDDALEVAMLLADLRLGPVTVAAGLAVAVADIERSSDDTPDSLSSGDVALLVDGVQRLQQVRWDRLDEEAAENLRRMFLAMAQDVRVVLVTLAWRVLRVRQAARRGGDEDATDDDDERRFAAETIEVFAPLANRLGVWHLKWELEDGALRIMEPEAYRSIVAKLKATRAERDALVAEVIRTVSEKLAEHGIRAEINGRSKHIYSIFSKMQRKQVGFEEIYDVSAIRVITDDMPSCYAALGFVHATWVPIPQEFDDYIAKPKGNGYQSLHTAVIGPSGRPVEVQFRTREMHELNEYGVAAHWAYKERKRATAGELDKFTVLRQLMAWERDLEDPHDFVESLKTDVFEDQAYVFTPAGDVVDLPKGATPLDFAYRIHTMVGHRCRGAKVNGKIVTLDTALKTGDRVEILTQKQPSPSRDWMNPSLHFLKTNSARQKVRHWYREQDRDTSHAQGRDIIERELGRLDLIHTTTAGIAAFLSYPTVEDLQVAVGRGDRSGASIATAALQVERAATPEPEEDQAVPEVVPPERKGPKSGASGVVLDGVGSVLSFRARCCGPVPGDEVVGFVTRGRGIAIHRRACNNIAITGEPERLVDIAWGGQDGRHHQVDVEIRANDRPGLLRDLANLVAFDGVNMSAAKAKRGRDRTAFLSLSLECRTATQVVKVIERLSRHPDVIEVRRRR